MSETSKLQHILVIDADGQHIASELSKRVPGARLVAASSAAEVPGDLTEFDGLACLGRHMSDALIQRMPRLRWLQFLTSGTDQLPSLTSLRSGTIVASAHGLHGASVTEMALMHMLNLARGVPSMMANQRAHAWQRRPQPLLNGKTLVVIGTGAIAVELARRCRVLGMRTAAVTGAPRAIAEFDEVYARVDLRQAAARADFLVALMPLTDETRGMVDETVFASMKPSAYFINLARGPVCVEADLVAALRDKTIAGAGLDVFDVEPLPVDNPLWDLPNVIITPHLGGESDRYADTLMPLLETNLRCLVEGRPADMLNARVMP